MSIRVAVLSDTHVGQRISRYPPEFLRMLGDFDMVIHAGDHTSLASLETLRQNCKRLIAVCGNMDEAGVTGQLKEKALVEMEDLRFGVIHGWGHPKDLEKRVSERFAKDNPFPDAIIFGHSHVPLFEEIEGIRYINPGSLSGNVDVEFGTWAILNIDKNRISWELQEIRV